MGIPIQSDNLKLVLANGKGSEFFVRSMVLDEGLGIIPTARLELCSSARGSVVEMDDLKHFIGMAATVEFKHLDVEGGEVPSVVSTRWMSGRVSSVEHLGVIDARNDGSDPVCGYRMTIRPSLAKLCQRRSRHQFANSTARRVLEALLDSCCEGEYAFPGRDCPVLDATRDFSQGDETDYEFFVRVLASCGLSYHCQMNRAKSLPTAPKLHIINALPSREQLSELEANYVSADDSKVTLCYKLPKLDGCLGIMTAWEMSQSDGVGSCSVSFGGAGGERLSGEETGTDKKDAVRLNHVPFDNIRSADEVKREVGVFLKSMRRNDGVWLGVTRRLEARVGASLVLRGFYGRSGSDIKDLVIARTRVRLESPIPSGQLGPWGSAGWRQYVSVGCISAAADAVTDFSALPTGRIGESEAFGGDRASGDFSHVEKTVSSSQGTGGGSRVQVNVEEDWRKAAGTTDAWQSTTMLVQATVCAPGGSTDSTNNTSALRKRKVSDTEEAVFYEFLAKPDGTDGVMVVRYVQPVGGLGQGLFRVPRIGDRILVARCSPSGASVGGINYLMGYLPGADMPHVTSWSGDHAKQMDALTLRFDQTETMKKDLCEGKGTAGNEVNEYDKLTSAERFDGAPCFRRGKKQNTFSELGFYDDHKSKVRAQKTYKSPVKINWGAWANWDVVHRKSPIEFNLEQRLLGFEDVDHPRGTLANLQSTGDVQISANNRVEVNGRNIHLGCPGWATWRNMNPEGKDADWQTVDGKVEIDDINELVVRANRRIVLNVGGSSLIIDKDGIAINSNRWREAQGIPFTTASMVVSGMQGVSISGQEVSISGAIGASIGDAAGGSFVANAGTASIGGSIIRSGTRTAAGVGVRFAVLLGQCLTPLKNFFVADGDSTVEGNCLPLGTFFGSCADLHFLRKYDDCLGQHIPSLKAIAALRLIGSIIDTSRMGVRWALGQYKWEMTPSEKMSVGDIMFLMSLLFKFTAWMTAWVALTAVNVMSGKSSTITLKSAGIDINAAERNTYAMRIREGNGPFAGGNAVTKVIEDIET